MVASDMEIDQKLRTPEKRKYFGYSYLFYIVFQ